MEQIKYKVSASFCEKISSSKTFFKELFDACRKPPVTLKNVPKDAWNLFQNPDMTCTLKKISMTEKETGTVGAIEKPFAQVQKVII
jgi:hypothetical protein